MLTERNGVQLKIHCLTLEDLVPGEHFLRKLEEVVDFSFIYDEVRDMYSKRTTAFPVKGQTGESPVTDLFSFQRTSVREK